MSILLACKEHDNVLNYSSLPRLSSSATTNQNSCSRMMKVIWFISFISVFASRNRPSDFEEEGLARKKLKFTPLSHAPYIPFHPDRYFFDYVSSLLETEKDIATSRAWSSTDVLVIFSAPYLLTPKVSFDKLRRFTGMLECSDEEWISLVQKNVSVDELKYMLLNPNWSILFPWNRVHLLGENLKHDLFQAGLSILHQLLERTLPSSGSLIATMYRLLYSLFLLEKDVTQYTSVLSKPFLDILQKWQLTPHLFNDTMSISQLVTSAYVSSMDLESLFEQKLVVAFAVHRSLIDVSALSSAPILQRISNNSFIYAELSCFDLPRGSFVETMERQFNSQPKDEFYISWILSVAGHHGFGNLVPTFSNTALQWTNTPIGRLLPLVVDSLNYPVRWFSPNLNDLYRISRVTIAGNKLTENISNIIPSLDGAFFRRNDIIELSAENTSAITPIQIRLFRLKNLGLINWSLLNLQTRNALLSDIPRAIDALVLGRNSIHSDKNWYLLPFNVFDTISSENITKWIDVFISSDGMFSVQRLYVINKITSQVPLAATLGNFIKFPRTFQFSRKVIDESLKEIFKTIESSDSSINWANLEIPAEFQAQKIDKVFGFSNIFTGISPGVYLSFFGFVGLDENVWSRVFHVTQFSHQLLLSITLDPLFGPLFPWHKLLKTRSCQHFKVFIHCLKRLLEEVLNITDESRNIEKTFLSWSISNVVLLARIEEEVNFGTNTREFYLLLKNSKLLTHEPCAYEEFFFFENYFNRFLESPQSILASRRTLWSLMLQKRNHLLLSSIKDNRAQKLRALTFKNYPEIYSFSIYGLSFIWSFLGLFEVPSGYSRRLLIERNSCCSNRIKCDKYSHFKVVNHVWNHFFLVLAGPSGSRLIDFLSHHGILNNVITAASLWLDLPGCSVRFDFFREINIPFITGSSSHIPTDSLIADYSRFIPLLGDRFFANNHFTQISPVNIAAILARQIVYFNPDTLARLSWVYFKDEVRDSFITNYSIVSKVLCSGVEIMAANWNYIKVDLISQLAKKIHSKDVPSLLSTWATMPALFKESFLTIFEPRKLKHLFTMRKFSLPTEFASLHSRQFLQFLSKDWTANKVYYIATYYKPLENPTVEAMVREVALSSAWNLSCFLQNHWDKQIILPSDLAYVSEEMLEEATEKWDKLPSENEQNLVHHLFNFFPHLCPSAQRIASKIIITGTAQSIVPVSKYDRKLWEVLGDEAFLDLLSKSRLATIPLLEMNMAHLTPSQVVILNEQAKQVDFLFDVLSRSRSDGILLSSKVWNQCPHLKGQKRKDILAIWERLSEDNHFKQAIPQGLAVNFPNMHPKTQELILMKACVSVPMMLGLLSSVRPFPLPPSFWTEVTEPVFSQIVRVFEGNIIFPYYDQSEIRSNIRRNLEFMTENQLARLKITILPSWITSWNRLIESKERKK